MPLQVDEGRKKALKELTFESRLSLKSFTIYQAIFWYFNYQVEVKGIFFKKKYGRIFIDSEFHQKLSKLAHILDKLKEYTRAHPHKDRDLKWQMSDKEGHYWDSENETQKWKTRPFDFIDSFNFKPSNIHHSFIIESSHNN